MKMTKKKLTSLIAIVTVLTLIVGTAAYFTDRVDSPNNPYTTADASEIIKVTPDGTEEGGEDPGPSLEDVWDVNNPDNPSDKPIEPGDDIDLSYELTNIGDSDIDVKETFILTSTEPLNQSAPEFRLFHNATADKYGAMEGGTVVSAEQISQYQIKYTLNAFLLKQNETIGRDFIMVFHKYAGNLFQGDKCTIDYLVEMRQHVESIPVNEGWDDIRTEKIEFAGHTEYFVVPAA